MAKRLLFDISTSMRWLGPPVGIVRVERELAKWAMRNRPACRFVFFDADFQAYREVRRGRLPALLDGAVTVDTTGMSDPSRSRRRRTDRVPRPLLTPFLWLTQFRRMALRHLGGMTINRNGGRMHEVLSSLQLVVAGEKYRHVLMQPDRSQRVLAPVGLLTGPPIALEPGDCVLFAGANWAHSNAALIAERKEQIGVELISLCNDVIPLLLPQYFKAHDVAMFKRYYERVFAIASLNLVSSKVVGSDIRKWCAGRGIAVGAIEQVPFGHDFPAAPGRSASPRDPPMTSGHILFVSTIEPRKGHGLVRAVWARLLEQGIPQKLDITLMLVGRPGWMVDDLMAMLRATERIAIMDSVDDNALAALYDRAAFCIYPSEYEGYGLPVVEALARGKAVLASDVGVVPELQSGLLKGLPPRDEQAWTLAIRDWLLRPDAVPRNADPATGFRHPTWQEAAERTFATIDAVTGLEGRTR